MSETSNRKEPEPGRVFESVEKEIENRDDWARRRRKDIPTDKQLMVVACMDERIPVEDALDIGLGDAHIFRNAGGKVTDDVVRSAILSTNFFDTTEIIFINHTDCGMMSAPDDAVIEGLKSVSEESLEDIDLDPSLPSLNIGDSSISDWIRMTDDIDEACKRQVEYLQDYPLIPDSVDIHGYIYEVESNALRRPNEKISEKINTRN